MNIWNGSSRGAVNLLCSALEFCKISQTTVRYVRRHKRKMRFSMPPFWQPKKIRVDYPENLTESNVGYLDEEVAAKYSSPLKTEIIERCEWQPGSYRCGLIAKKIGVYPMWDKTGNRMLTTLLQIPDNQVIKYIPPEEMFENDYRYKNRIKTPYLGGLVVGADSADPRIFAKEYLSLFQESGVVPKKRLTKFFITPNARLAPGTPLSASHYRPGDFVDCLGVTIDRGFQGVMKRWDFKGGRATHGVTKSHRRPGNIGGGGKIARVWPGTKMPGHMGRRYRVLRGIQVLRVNTVQNVIWVSSHGVAGEIGKYVIIYDSILPKARQIAENHVHFPTFFQEEEEIEEELYHERLHNYKMPSINFNDPN